MPLCFRSLAAACVLAASVPVHATAATVAADTRPGATLAHVRKAGIVACGLVADENDYSESDTHGNLTALGADYCRALAAEIFGDQNRARFLTQPDEPTALAKLRDGKIDVLFGATPSPVMGLAYHVAFGPPMMLDGFGFLVSNESGIRTIADLSGKRLCFINASAPEREIDDLLDPVLKTPEKRFPYSERGEMNVALEDGHCDATAGDVSLMANVRGSFDKRASRFHVLDATLSVDPFSPAYRLGDTQWAALVDWTVWVPLQAEIHGIDHATMPKLGNSADPVVQRLLGHQPWIGRSLGISDSGFTRALEQVGNAEEIFDRDVGAHSALGLPRGRSAPVERGGALWSLTVRSPQ
ncbi:transporter substrate-binding domain-containing protein [Acetobacteraceae bacterium KSS8]|uniref:Transporter substrate-binding domain-containing protein n=1 Tax=Endosaccharibacter trunci TaxID=2812733 RepID=A0ABT1W8D4_9PROT|nr:transporter substrate-binding domain-containing protein [Acetobacteraceae bacterium KSS8]